MRCITFGTEFPHRTLRHYYIKYVDGTIRSVWAFDMCDMMDVFGTPQVHSYGAWGGTCFDYEV